MKKLLYILLFATIATNSYAHFTVTSKCKQAYSYIFNLEFEKGRQILATEKVLDPKNSIPYLYENYIDFLTVVIGEDYKTFEKAENNKDKRLNIIEKDDKKSPYYLYAQAQLHLQGAFARLKFQEYVTGAYELRKAFKLLESNRKKFPNFELNNKLLGFFHAFVGGIPDQYQWIVRFAGFSGTIDQGIKELNEFLEVTKTQKEYYHLQEEALAILSMTQINVQFDKNKLRKTLKCYETVNQNNILVQYSKSVIYGRMAKNDEAIQMLLSIKQTPSQFPFHAINYALGTAKLKRQDKDANVYLLKFVNQFNGTTYKKSAYLKLAWYYQLNGDDVSYWKNLENCINKGGEAYIDEDKYAYKYAKSKQKSDIILLKARLFFDGGYYQKAINILHSNKSRIPKTAYNNLEFLYRNARCYHELKNYSRAIEYYNEAIKEGSTLKYYFAAKSALELGEIYEELQQCEKSVLYYKKSMQIPSDEYKTSMTQQAKAGIRRVGKCEK